MSGDKHDTSSKGLPILSDNTVIKTRLGPLLGFIGLLLSSVVWATMTYTDIQALKTDVKEIKDMLSHRGYKSDTNPIGLIP